ncbi:carbamoyl-phosphate synthase large subunit, partial [Streptomyces kronopolitis]|uniref:carbamoyl-phosphate synthase large subunit n=1 Tax=Streptomyces kronopolitis TaxID=1612435 RepID=UPI0016656284
SVGEAMAIGRNFSEALNKALRSLEKKGSQFDFTGEPGDKATLLEKARIPTDGRINTVMQAMRAGATPQEVFDATKIDPWFVDQLFLILEHARELATAEKLDPELLTDAKRHGFSDAQIAAIRGLREDVVREVRHALGVRPVYKTVDTCAAEFAAKTPYFYSSYDEESEVAPREKPAVIILGSGPNRIGQGIEFDYSCVHASFALSDAGYETVMVNCNPETVSTDYDTSDRLYFEPLTLEDVLEIVHAETQAGPVAGVIVQLGGQTPLGLAQALKDNGVPIVGTPPEAIHAAEDRGAFGQVLAEAGLPAPEHGTATTFDRAREIAEKIGYPVLVRPSYVLGGRGMEIVYDEARLCTYIAESTEISPTRPVLVDRFLDDAIEIDVDALYDGHELYLGGVMEHIEEAGIHSGDSACALPPITLGGHDIKRLRASTEAIAKGVGVRGLINIQFAMAGDILYVLEANPRASRTVPFTSKATAVPLAKAAARLSLGATIAELRAEGLLPATGDGGTLPLDAPISVKEAVLPWSRFRDIHGRGVDTVLGPEMRSTGEVMGIDAVFGTAYAKSQTGAYGPLPTKGRAFLSVAHRDKPAVIFPARELLTHGFELLATSGTAEVLRRNGINATVVRKQSEGEGPNGERTIVQLIHDAEIDLIVNTPHGPDARLDGYEIRTAAVARGVPCLTTIQALAAALQGIQAMSHETINIHSLQEHAMKR